MWKEQKRGTQGDSRVNHWCSYYILKSSVIYYWTDARQHGIYLFYIIKKQTKSKKLFCFKIFQHINRVHFDEHEKRPFDVTCGLYKTKRSYWLLCVEKNCDSSGKVRPLSRLIRASLLVEWELTAKADSPNLKENAGDVDPVFVFRQRPASRKAWKLPWMLRELKNAHGKLAVTALEAIRLEFWMKEALVTGEIRVLCGWWFSN